MYAFRKAFGTNALAFNSLLKLKHFRREIKHNLNLLGHYPR